MKDDDDGWEWYEPTDDELAAELLEPYRALAKPDHPFAPLARRILDLGTSYETYELMREAMLAWPDSTLAALDDLATYLNLEDSVAKGRLKVIEKFLELRFSNPLHPGRRRELERLGYETGLDDASTWAATVEAGFRGSDARDPEGLSADQIRNLFEKVDKAFRSHFNEAATEIIAPGSRSERRRSKDIQITQLEEHHGSADGEEFSPDLFRRDFQKLEMLASLTQEEAKIMEMAVFEGLTAKEIAKSRGRAESTVRVQILNARKKLRSVRERIA